MVTLVFWLLPQFGVEIQSRVPVESQALQSLFNRLSAVLAIGILVVLFIDNHRRSEQRVQQLAYFDVVTELPNRRSFQFRLAKACDNVTNERIDCALLFIDLDRFKTINDSLGHHIGDELLKAVSQRLTNVVGQLKTPGIHHHVARFGGDEFTVLLEGHGASAAASEVAENIVHHLCQPLAVTGYELYPGASIGIARAPVDATHADELMRNADKALYEAKERGGGQYAFCTAAQLDATRRRLNLENRLRRALQREEISVHYQPLIDSKTGDITSVEALMRWSTGSEGSISPGEFIPVAEATGLILPLGEWILQTACMQAQAWRKEGHEHLRLSVNVSPHQLRHASFFPTLKHVLAESGLPPGQLELEITESTVLEADERSRQTIHQINALGVHLALDDFGTGYSSLVYLRSFPFASLKIDRTFISSAPSNPDDAELITAIITMARRLSLRVVAEGVETSDHVRLLQSLGCGELQGFLFSRPVPHSELHQQLVDQPHRLTVAEYLTDPHSAIS